MHTKYIKYANLWSLPLWDVPSRAADCGGMWQPGAAVVEGRALPGLGRIQEYHPRRGHGMPMDAMGDVIRHSF